MPFSGTLEPLQFSFNSFAQLLGSKSLENPSPPSRREAKVSAKADARISALNRSASNVIVDSDSQR